MGKGQRRGCSGQLAGLSLVAEGLALHDPLHGRRIRVYATPSMRSALVCNRMGCRFVVVMATTPRVVLSPAGTGTCASRRPLAQRRLRVSVTLGWYLGTALTVVSTHRMISPRKQAVRAPATAVPEGDAA
jgi:hypothetical protein